MGLLNRMKDNGTSTVELCFDATVEILRNKIGGWEAAYRWQIVADEEANQRTLSQMQRDIEARQASRCLS